MTLVRQVLVFILFLSPALAGAEEIRVRADDCRWLTAHQPGGADYVPGVAADGSPVAPADLSPQISLPRDIILTIKADLYEEYGIGADSPLLDTEAHIGVVVVRDDAVFFNGQRLGDAEAGLLAEACREEGRGE